MQTRGKWTSPGFQHPDASMAALLPCSLPVQATILHLMAEMQLGEVCSYTMTDGDEGKLLGEALASAVAAQRARSAQPPFVDQLPPLEDIASGTPDDAQPAPEQLGRDANGQLPGASPADPPDQGDDDFALDIIDAIAAGEDAVAPTAHTGARDRQRANWDAEPLHVAPSERPVSSGDNAQDSSTPLSAASGSDLEVLDDATLPGMEDFILSQQRLRELAAEAGFDYATVMTLLEEKGIRLDG